MVTKKSELYSTIKSCAASYIGTGSVLKSISPNWGLLGLVSIAVIINLPGLLGYILPTRDTMFMFQTFYFFYNDFFFSGDIPQWLPFGLYGVQSDNSIVAILSPATYLAGLTGYVAGIRDVLFLFHLAILFEEIIFLTGTYLVAGLIFRERGVAFIVSLVALCSSVLMVQFLLNFHIFSLLPLVIYLLLKAFRTFSWRYISLSMVVFIISFFGNPPYFIPIPALTVLVISIPLVISNLRKLPRFFRPSKVDLAVSALFFCIFLSIAALYFLFIKNAMDYTEGVYIGRDPVTLKTDLNTFLTYANDSGAVFKKFGALIFPYSYVLEDLTLHVGFITLLFASIGLLSMTSGVPLGFVAVIIFFGLFSMGGKTPLAEFLYNYFPMMDYFRHIRDVVSNYKLFIPLLAGYGLERVLRLSSQRRGLILAVEILSVLAMIIGGIVYSSALIPGEAYHAAAFSIVFAFVLFLLRYRFGVLSHTVHFLIACFLFQMLSYQILVTGVMHRIAKRVSPFDKAVVSVYDYDFQDARTETPFTKRAVEASRFINVTKINYAFAYNFLLWDPCDPDRRVDFMNKNVADYFKLKGARFVDIEPLNNTFGKRLQLPYDWDFMSSIGCVSSKLKLFRNPYFSSSLEESRIALMGTADTLILNGIDRELWPKLSTASPVTESVDGVITVKDFSANRLSLEVDTNGESGVWLYYADAFHPGWKASVNGRIRQVAQANIGFKALSLDPGKSRVELFFENEPSRSMGRIIAIIGIVFTAVILLTTFKMCFKRSSD